MAAKQPWTGGTIDLVEGSTDFTVADADLVNGIGASAGDEIIHPSGLRPIIDTIVDATHGTLLDPCPAACAGAGQALRIRYQADVSRYTASVRQLIALLANTNLSALAGLTGAAEKGIGFTGVGTMEVFDETTLMRAMLGLTPAINQIPYFKDAGDGVVAPSLTAITALGLELLGDADGSALASNMPATMTADKAFRRGNILGTVAQSGGAPTGALIENGSTANGQWIRFADGTQICRLNAEFSMTLAAEGNVFGSNGSGFYWSFPAAFASQPAAFVSAADGNWYNTSMNGVTQYAARLRIMSGYSTTLDATYNFVAIGRWI